MSNLNIPAEKWLEEMFECHYCDECGGDAQHHTAVPVMGNWFARCDYPRQSSGKLHPTIAEFRGCQHDIIDEDCMICIECGQCNETLDENDICQECREKASINRI